MTTIIGGSSPSITFSDSTTQTTAFTSTPSVTSITTSGDSSISGLTVGRGAGANAYNTTVGSAALAGSNTGANNTAIGYGTLFSNTSGASGTAVGTSALLVNSTGSYNTAVGMQALTSNTTASNNTAVGYQAGYSNTTGDQSVYIGTQAAYTLTTGTNNTVVGFKSGYSLTTGTGNTFIGNGYNQGSGYSMTTGSRNTIIGGYTGNSGGLDIRTSNNYIVLSDGDGNPRGIFNNDGSFIVGSTTADNASGVGFKVLKSTTAPYVASVYNVASGENNYFFYNTNATNSGYRFYVNVNGGIYNYSGNNSNLSDERTKNNIELSGSYLSKICSIPVKTFNYKDEPTGEQKTLGVIAQDVETIAPELVNNAGFGKTPEDGIPLKSIYTTDMMFALMKSIQELKTIVDAQAAEIAELKAKVA